MGNRSIKPTLSIFIPDVTTEYYCLQPAHYKLISSAYIISSHLQHFDKMPAFLYTLKLQYKSKNVFLQTAYIYNSETEIINLNINFSYDVFSSCIKSTCFLKEKNTQLLLLNTFFGENI